jgi:hypothetical protein
MSKISTTETQVTPFVWGDISLSQTIMLDGVPHATRGAIGEWAEYADPQNAIDVILGRNPHIKDWGIPVRLTGMGGAREYETVVYHPIGFMLIAMESGQPKAHAMKQAVAKFVWHFAGPRQMTFKERTELLKLRRAILNDLAKIKDAFVQKALFADLVEISLALGQPVPDIKYLGKDIGQLLLEGV